METPQPSFQNPGVVTLPTPPELTPMYIDDHADGLVLHRPYINACFQVGIYIDICSGLKAPVQSTHVPNY